MPKTDGSNACLETWLCNTVANGEVQLVEVTGLIKDMSPFKGNKWAKMPVRYAVTAVRPKNKQKNLTAGAVRAIPRNRSVFRENAT